ncbi:uncharacterized protein EI90DRAFT_3036233 [Cantharellus anzutake]|uniref:uncharacterized protein n=1 Tax=Cantharellus anzutake TaxID=1750568 RepID=UPI0019084307|nr:uncharacterized protein EI90DRAFT_3036233 [Cantharellus anzutake]KAF8340628.1 hypothetical protein EI90DRAFT_3036233 [Cantharellus anzutake]
MVPIFSAGIYRCSVIRSPSRHILFPSTPLSAVSAATGALQVPPVGRLASKDSLSGAEETCKG